MLRLNERKYEMKNLCCRTPDAEAILDINRNIVSELTEAGFLIDVIPNEQDINPEVPTNLIGRLKGFTATRAWTYWVVEGKLDMDSAREIYESPCGKRSVRAGGDCGCEPPETQSNMFDRNTGAKVFPDESYDECVNKFELDMTGYMRESEADVVEFVTCYHIDTQAGLNLFASIVNR